ncbi:hypothetical protein GGI35DRAFT_37478 [Trichoderma velutinum]
MLVAAATMLTLRSPQVCGSQASPITATSHLPKKLPHATLHNVTLIDQERLANQSPLLPARLIQRAAGTNSYHRFSSIFAPSGQIDFIFNYCSGCSNPPA